MGLPITPGCDTAWIRTRVSVVTPLALRYSALDHCATQESPMMSEALFDHVLFQIVRDPTGYGGFFDSKLLSNTDLYWTPYLQICDSPHGFGLT